MVRGGVVVGAGTGVGVVMEMQMGMTDRGAEISWLSMYPGEAEILFGPLTGLEVVDSRVDDGLVLVQVRLSVNLSSLTLEQVAPRARQPRGARRRRLPAHGALFVAVGRRAAAGVVLVPPQRRWLCWVMRVSG